jgi:histidinol dehydrogenase
VIQTIDLRSEELTPKRLATAVPRPTVDVTTATEVATELIEAVRSDGMVALIDQARKFDGVDPRNLRTPAEDIAAALAELDPEVRAALDEVIARVRAATAAQVPPPQVTELGPGARVRQRWQPVGRVGLYVPGGKAVYPSSVIMNVVPAQIAGVASIAIASPPQRDAGGRVHPTILAAAALLGIDEVYAMGGAGAIGAFAYGVPELGLEPVDVVTGPGNIYVAAAKRIVHGVVGIDAEAGPTEILVIADESADPALVAADLVSQAEHDEQAAAVLVTDSPELALAVEADLEALVGATRHGDRARIALGSQQSAIVLVDDLAAAVAFSNAYAPEHLEIQTADDEAVLAGIRDAGAIFLGPNSPVSLGDYLAGSNHVLPTGGHVRFSSGLSAMAFLRPQQIIEYDAEGLGAVRDRIVALAEAEDLPAHGEAVLARFADRTP